MFYSKVLRNRPQRRATNAVSCMDLWQRPELATKKFRTEEKWVAFARKKVKEWKEWKETTEEIYKEMKRYTKERKAWELALVLRAWDEKWGIFPPKVKREDLGDIDWVEPSDNLTDPSTNPTGGLMQLLKPWFCMRCPCENCRDVRKEIVKQAAKSPA